MTCAAETCRIPAIGHSLVIRPVTRNFPIQYVGTYSSSAVAVAVGRTATGSARLDSCVIIEYTSTSTLRTIRPGYVLFCFFSDLCICTLIGLRERQDCLRERPEIS